MKNIFVVILSFVFFLILISCGNGSDNGDNANVDQYNIAVSIASDEIIELSQNSMPIVVLYGYDESDAYTAAIPIVTQRVQLDAAPELPYDTNIDLTENPAQTVCPDYDESNPCQVRYYLQTYIDVDGDGRICKGDLHQDYAASSFELYTLEELTAKEHEISTKVKIDSSCEEVGGPGIKPIEELYQLPVLMVSNEDLQFNQGAMPIVVLYGYDERNADGTAFPIVIQRNQPKGTLELPYGTIVSLRDEPAPFVCQAYNDDYTCPVRYYFRVYVDVDVDGLICPGDVVQDYTMTPYSSYTLGELADSEHEIYMKVKEDDGSGCFSPTDSM